MFYEKLDTILKKKNLTMNKLAKNAGVAQASTVRWKNGSIPNSDALIKICKYLNVSADYLLELEPQQPDILSDKEKRLIEYFRRIDDDVGKDIVLELAKREASRYGPPEEKSYNSRIG